MWMLRVVHCRCKGAAKTGSPFVRLLLKESEKRAWRGTAPEILLGEMRNTVKMKLLSS